MKFSVYLLRSIIWSLIFSVLIRILYGIHAVYGIPGLIAPILFGVFAALLFAPPKNGNLIIISVIHMVAFTSLTFILDTSGIMKSLASDSIEFLAKNTDINLYRINIFWSVLLVNALYFAAYVISSVLICRIRSSHTSDKDEDSVDYNDDAYKCDIADK